jgi:hypothetical protein
MLKVLVIYRKTNEIAVDRLDRIYVQWANSNIAIPPDLQPYAVRSTSSSLNERFMIPPSLRTQAVFLADDDMLYDSTDVDLAFRAWQMQPCSPVGFFARMHLWDDDLGLYFDAKDQYSSEPCCVCCE